MKRSPPNPIDVHVGGRVRLRRMLVGISQQRLGSELGITFQQIQKYEKGDNRIGASRLYLIASILGAPVQFFFDDMPTGIKVPSSQVKRPNIEDTVITFINSKEGVQLNTAFAKIENPEVRKGVLGLARELAEI